MSLAFAALTAAAEPRRNDGAAVEIRRGLREGPPKPPAEPLAPARVAIDFLSDRAAARAGARSARLLLAAQASNDLVGTHHLDILDDIHAALALAEGAFHILEAIVEESTSG